MIPAEPHVGELMDALRSLCLCSLCYVLQLRGIWDLFFLILGAFPWGQGPVSTVNANTVK